MQTHADQNNQGSGSGPSGIEPSRLMKGDVFKRLSVSVPINDYRLPTHIYRADLVPANIFEHPQSERQGILEAASLELSFNHGYPAINDVEPFWSQLPAEPTKAFDAFIIYLELPETTNADNPIRFLPVIAHLTDTPLEQLADWCEVYYWHWRSRAYDMFLVACHRKQREHRVMTIEGQHFKMAESMLASVSKLAEATLKAHLDEAATSPDSLLDGSVKLKDLIDSATKLVAIQRISVGLPSGGPSQVDVKYSGPRNADVNETFKEVAKESSHEVATTRRSDDVDSLLANPDDLTAIQDMMIRLARPDHILPAWGHGRTVDVKVNVDEDADLDEFFDLENSGSSRLKDEE